jgi:hypothetical protein
LWILTSVGSTNVRKFKVENKEKTMSNTINKKSGKGIAHGVVSELTAFFTVKPGQEEQLRAAIKRFADALHQQNPDEIQQIGLRDSRMVIFDNGRRMLWTTTFDTDWDPYLDDAMLLFGVDNFIGWMKYVEEAETLTGWMQSVGGRAALLKSDDPEWIKSIPQKSAGLKQIIQSVQVPAGGYFNAIADETIRQVRKAQQVNQAFQQVLDNPAAAQALQQPALKPLLEQASA